MHDTNSFKEELLREQEFAYLDNEGA